MTKFLIVFILVMCVVNIALFIVHRIKKGKVKKFYGRYMDNRNTENSDSVDK